MATFTLNGIKIAHDDHDLKPKHLAAIDQILSDWNGSFIKMCVPLPYDCPDLLSALHGPVAGDPPITDDQVTYEKRNNRHGPSRLIDAPMRPARNIVLIGMRDEGGTLLLFTAYGTQASEPSDVVSAVPE